MATVEKSTLEQFEEIINLPENSDKTFELMDGEILEKMPNSAYNSEIAMNIGFFIKSYLLVNNKKGHVSGEGGGYHVGKDVYAPDIAYTSFERQPQLDQSGFNRLSPELAVEVVSPSDKQQEIVTKVGNYIAAGVVVWVVYPQSKEVAVHVSGQFVQTLGLEDTLQGGDLLPGFQLPIKQIFPD
jgi:Uma2 family endonuclease